MDDFEELDEFIIEHVIPTLKELKTHGNDGTYKAKILCRHFWKDFEEDHQLIGRRIRWLAMNNRLPVMYAGKDSANHAVYRLK